MARRAPLVAVDSDTPLTPRLSHLVRQEEPPVELEWGLQCLRDGGSEAAAALRSGLTVAEWQQVKKWGAAGHPAFAVFYGDYLAAKGLALYSAQSRLHKRALEEGELAYIKATEDVILDGRIGGERVAGGGASASATVIIRKDFDD